MVMRLQFIALFYRGVYRLQVDSYTHPVVRREALCRLGGSAYERRPQDFGAVPTIRLSVNITLHYYTVIVIYVRKCQV